MNRAIFTFEWVSLFTVTALSAGVVGCGGDSNSNTPPQDSGMASRDSATTNPDAGVADATVADAPVDACSGGIPLTFAEGSAALVPSPYRQFADSPFACLPFADYFHLATFEGDGGLPPGTTGPGSKFPGNGVTSGIVDSVDGDDGFPNGSPPDAGTTHPCPGCQSWFGPAPDFTFDEEVLGALPTHVGLVWTDDATNASVTITAFDATDAMVAQRTFTGIGTSGVSGQTEEDRFFGVVFSGGIKRFTLSHTGGGYEIDHIQIGR